MRSAIFGISIPSPATLSQTFEAGTVTRYTPQQMDTDTLRKTLERERDKWGPDGPPESIKPLIVEIEAELARRERTTEAASERRAPNNH